MRTQQACRNFEIKKIKKLTLIFSAMISGSSQIDSTKNTCKQEVVRKCISEMHPLFPSCDHVFVFHSLTNTLFRSLYFSKVLLDIKLQLVDGQSNSARRKEGKTFAWLFPKASSIVVTVSLPGNQQSLQEVTAPSQELVMPICHRHQDLSPFFVCVD